MQRSTISSGRNSSSRGIPRSGCPRRARRSRGAHLATLETIVHDRQIDDRIGELLDDVEPYASTLPDDADDACLVRVARRRWEKKRRIPTDLAAEIAGAQVESYQAWVKAREESSFADFRPSLERIVELQRRLIECFAPYDDPYDVVLDDYEEGTKTEDVRVIFAALQPEITALVAEHAAEADEDEFLRGPFAIPAQEALSRELICTSFLQTLCCRPRHRLASLSHYPEEEGMHEKSNVETMIAGVTVGVTHSAQDGGMAKLTPLHREVVQGMPRLPEQEVRVLSATLLPGDVTPHHSHRFPVTVFMLEGTFTLALAGREPVAIEAGQVFVEPAGVTMTGYNKGAVPARMALFYVCETDAPFADPVDRELA